MLTRMGIFERIREIEFKGKKLEVQEVYEGHARKELNDQVTPLWRMPYAEQLALKQDQMLKVMNKFAQETGQEIGHPEPIIPSLHHRGIQEQVRVHRG